MKPQLAFEVKPDNEDTSPWLPLLKTKPHAKVPLEDSLGMITNEFHQKQYDCTSFISLALLHFGPPRKEKKSEELGRFSRASRSKGERDY